MLTYVLFVDCQHKSRLTNHVSSYNVTSLYISYKADHYRLSDSKARSFCKTNPLNPLRFYLSPEKLRQTKCLLFNFWMVNWPKHKFCEIAKWFIFGITALNFFGLRGIIFEKIRAWVNKSFFRKNTLFNMNVFIKISYKRNLTKLSSALLNSAWLPYSF